MPSCESAANRYLGRDYCRAQELFVRACEKGEWRACDQAGLMVEKNVPGTGILGDAARAAQLFARGCDGGDPRACMNLALAYRSGKGVAKDAKRADRYEARAKELGYDKTLE